MDRMTHGTFPYSLIKNLAKSTVIDEWNSLPESVIHSNTVNTFKAKTDCLFKNRDIYISY